MHLILVFLETGLVLMNGECDVVCCHYLEQLMVVVCLTAGNTDAGLSGNQQNAFRDLAALSGGGLSSRQVCAVCCELYFISQNMFCNVQLVALCVSCPVCCPCAPVMWKRVAGRSSL